MEAKHLALYILLPLLVLGIVSWWIYGPSGAGSSLKKVTDKLKGFLPDVSLGAKSLEAEKPTLPPYHEQAVRRLVNTIQVMLSSDRQHCFSSYQGLPKLEDKGTIIQFSADSIKTSILGGRQEVTDLNRELSAKLAGFKPCVVAGPATENFEISFLNEKPWSDKRIVEPLYLPVQEMVIKYDGENKIDFGYGDKDMEDGGILYSPSQGRVCFFPTVNAIQDLAKYDGLNDDYLGEDPEQLTSLPRQLKEKKIPPCTGPWKEQPGTAVASSPEQILPGGVEGTSG